MIEHGNPQSLVAEQTCNGKRRKSNNDQQTMTDMNYFDSNSKNLFFEAEGNIK